MTPAQRQRRNANYIANALADPNWHGQSKPALRAELAARLVALTEAIGTCCDTCGARLSDPESIAAGRGPVCAHKAMAAA